MHGQGTQQQQRRQKRRRYIALGAWITQQKTFIYCELDHDIVELTKAKIK